MCPDAIDEGRYSQVSVLNYDEIVYSVGSDCTNLNQCRITVSFNLRQTPFSFHVYAVLRDSGYSGPIVADTDTYSYGSSTYFTETSWLALHKEKGDNFMLQPCA